MDFIVKEADVVKLVLGYLKHNGCYESLSSLVLESSVALDNLGSDVAYLQRLVLQGRWDAFEKALEAMKPDLSPHIMMQLTFLMRRQKYLELLSWQSGGEQRMAYPPWKPLRSEAAPADSEGNLEMGVILQHLNTLKGLCSVTEFNSLCAFLTLEKLEDHPDYHKWTVAQGRWNCSSLMAEVLSPLLADGKAYTPVDGAQLENGLIKTVAMSLAYQQALATDKPFDSNHAHQTAVLSSETGYIVPADDALGNPSSRNVDISANVVLQSPVAFRKQFDEPFAAPKVARMTKTPLASGAAVLPNESQQRAPQGELFTVHSNEQRDAFVPPQPLQANAAVQQVRPELAPVPAAHNQAPPLPAYQQPQMPIQFPAPQYSAPPYGAPQYVPLPGPAPAPVPVQPYVQQNPGGQNVFAFVPGAGPQSGPYAGAQQPIIYTVQQPYPYQQQVQQAQQAPLSIEVTDGAQYPGSAFPTGAAPTNGNGKAYAPYSQYTAPQGSQAYGSFTPNGQGDASRWPAASQHPEVMAPNSGYSNQYTSAPQVVPGPQSAGRSQAPESVRSVQARAPLAWTVEDEQPEVPAEQTPGQPTRTDPSSKVIHVASAPTEAPPPAAFTVGEPEVKVKPMPAALRRKMLADQEAAAAAEEERQRMQAENLAAERATSRGRSRSAPRGAAAGSNISFTSQGGAGPPSSSRPPSAVRTRGVLKQTDEPQVGPAGLVENVVVMKERPGSVNSAVRKSHDKVNVEPVARPPSAGSQASAKRNLAGPASSSAALTKPAGDRASSHVTAASSSNSEYFPHVLFESKCPLRCAAVLAAGPERTHLAVGSNAKSIYTMSFSSDAMRGRGVHAGQDATALVSVDRELKNVHNGSVYCMDWHAGLGLLVSGSNDKALRISNPNSGQISEPMKEHNGTIRVVRFLQSGGAGSPALVASAGAGDCKPRLWDAQRGSLVRALTEHPDSVHGLVWVNDNILVTGCDDGCVIGHDLRSARPAWSYNLNDVLQNDPASRKGLCCLALLRSPQSGAADGFASPHNVPMVAGSVGGFVTIFNAVNGQVFSHNQLHQDDVRSICVLSASARPNGAQHFDVLTGSYDHTAAVWSISSDAAQNVTFGPQPVVLRGHTDKVLNAVSFAGLGHDNKRSSPQVVTTGADGKVIYWNQKHS